ncbi:hypothetical protein [Persicobacter sp. CCB-QB2]|uniref:hypothetical protein n=1 Tax=Persicobacter sp. CCB-QB2 TaxID=1561025 RepID=UPI0006A9E738|nr:hypothetical protein [Persicobacter sp. CCB-QB2]
MKPMITTLFLMFTFFTSSVVMAEGESISNASRTNSDIEVVVQDWKGVYDQLTKMNSEKDRKSKASKKLLSAYKKKGKHLYELTLSPEEIFQMDLYDSTAQKVKFWDEIYKAVEEEKGFRINVKEKGQSIIIKEEDLSKMNHLVVQIKLSDFRKDIYQNKDYYFVFGKVKEVWAVNAHGEKVLFE